MCTLAQRLVALALLLLCLPACGKFDFQGQDLALRHDAVADTLDLELTYKGVRMPSVTTTRENTQTGAAEPGGIDGVCAAIEAVAARQRYFMLFYKALELDLDKLTAELRVEQTASPREENRALLALMESTSVSSAVVYMDQEGRLGIRQQIHLKGARRAMALLNRALHTSVLESDAAGIFAVRTKNYFDDATCAALVAEAKLGTPWVRWNKADLIIDLPLSSATSARLLVLLLEELSEEDERSARAFAPVLFGLIKDMRVDQNRTRLTLSAGRDGRLHMQLEEDEREYDDTLLRELRAREFVFSADPTLGQ